MPNPWTIIGWLLLLAIVLAVVVVALTLLAQQAEAERQRVGIVRTADVPPDARAAGAREEAAEAPS